ncbi:unnamed protein product [Lathyrus sativus]|nr:unnamed protein product [Lathyrus sativus]
MTIVYAHNQLNKRRELWDHIQGLTITIKDPWVVIGEYNNVLTVDDRVGGCPVHEVEYQDLDMMMRMKITGLFEHNTTEKHYTWSKNHTNGAIYSRIDRAICNK